MENVITFGCRLNIFESEVIKDSLAKSDVKNVLVFNTCSVTQEAEKQAIKSIRKARKDNPDKRIIVTGCAAQVNPQKYSDLDEVDLVLGNTEKFNAQNYNENITDKILVSDIMQVKETAGHLVTSFGGKTRAFIEIQNGCNHRCTFCTIPFGRGNNRSVPIGDIVKQVSLLVKQGYKEIVLTGVDITDYGLNLPGTPSLGDMTKRLLSLVPNLPRLRLSSIDVAEVDNTLLQLILYEKRLMPHFHISLQSGDNMILKRMKRRHNRNQVIDFCNLVRKYRKDVAFGADIIAGFPTETEEMFTNSLNLIKESKIQYIHAFPYSERDGTPAARMPQVKQHLRKERTKALIEQGKIELSEFSKKYVGQTVSALVEKNNVGVMENFLKIYISENVPQNNIENIYISDFVDNKLIGKIVR